MREITLNTKIADLLDGYPDMKNILIAINPKFKKLNNPVLRRTLGRVAGVKQAAIVGGMDPIDLLNQLRAAVGQPSLCEACTDPSEDCLMPNEKPAPGWIRPEPKAILDANELLDADQNPLAISRKKLRKFEQGDVLVLEADFRPEPLIDEFEKDGLEVYTRETNEGKFLTYLRKP